MSFIEIGNLVVRIDTVKTLLHMREDNKCVVITEDAVFEGCCSQSDYDHALNKLGCMLDVQRLKDDIKQFEEL